MTTADTGSAETTPDGPTYRSVFVRAGRNGWGRGLELTPTAEKNKVISVTGGGVHAVAQRIAELSGAEAVDGFRTRVPDEEVLAAVINCGGTARLPGVDVHRGDALARVDPDPGRPAAVDDGREHLLVGDVGAEAVDRLGAGQLGDPLRDRVDAAAGHRDDLVLLRGRGQLEAVAPAVPAGADEHRPVGPVVAGSGVRAHFAAPSSAARSNAASNDSNSSVLPARRIR